MDFLVERANPARVGLTGSRGASSQRFGGHFDLLEREHLPAACPANYIGRISPRPLLMLNSLQDGDFIKERSVDPLFGLANDPKRILWSPGGHGQATEEHQTAMNEWLRDQLR